MLRRVASSLAVRPRGAADPIEGWVWGGTGAALIIGDGQLHRRRDMRRVCADLLRELRADIAQIHKCGLCFGITW